VIRRWAPKLLAPRSLPQPDTWLTVRLYEDVDGIHGLYRRLKADFWQAVDGGRTPGLRCE
jgi:hypothetical protein